jgi:hypothetical protein
MKPRYYYSYDRKSGDHRVIDRKLAFTIAITRFKESASLIVESLNKQETTVEQPSTAETLDYINHASGNKSVAGGQRLT